MAKKDFIPIPPPAPIPSAEELDVPGILDKYIKGETDLICVMGPTASGKTKYAVRLAHELTRLCNDMASAHGDCPVKGVEIISADSRQVYVGMDIGTGKDLCDYEDIPYHLIDIVPAGAKYNIYQYQRDFSAVYSDCLKRGVLPILCGGSGLYIESVTRPEYELGENATLGLVFPKKTYFIATVVDRDTRRARIDKRLDARFEEGMLIEVKNLLASGIPPEDLIYYGLEYKYTTLYLLGEINVEEMHAKLQTAIHQFAKRQMTWLRGMERDGVVIHWVEP